MLWIKKFRTKKLQSSMIFLIILMCTLLITGSAIILTSLNKPYHDLIEETDPVDMKVYPVVNSLYSGKDWITELGNLNSVNEVNQVDRHYMTEKIKAGENKVDIFITLAVYNKKVHSRVRVLKGNMDGLKENECFIPSVIANEENIGIGDTISFYYGKQHFDYKVKAIFADAYSLSTSFQIETFVQTLPEALENEPYYAIDYKEGYRTEDIVKEYGEKKDGLIDANFTGVEESLDRASITERILGGILLGMSIIVFLVSLVMIRYMIRNSLQKDKKTIAIYKAIGYTDKDIEAIYITFYQIIVFAGTLIGTLATPVITGVFLSAAFENLGVLQKIGLIQSLISISFINLLVYVQLKKEIGKIKKIRPVEILNSNETNLGVKKSRKKLFGQCTFSPISMAFRMLQRDRKNTILILITCLLSTYIVNVSMICFYNINDMRKSNYYWLGFDKHDVSGEALGNLDNFYQICEKLKNDPDVARLTRRNFNKGFAIPFKQSVSAMVYESYDGIEVPVLAGGRNPQRSNEVVIGNIYAKKLNKEIGDYFEVFLDQNTKVSLLIVGTYQGFYNMGRGMRIRGDLLKENNIPIDYPECSIKLKDGVDKKSFVKRVNKIYGKDAEFVIRENLYANIIDMICSPQKAAIGPFAVLTILIGALNLVYIIYSKNMNNRKIYCIYKSLGYTSGHLIKMNCCYVAMLAIVSIVITVPVFFITFPKIMVLAMSAFGFAEYRLVFDPLSMIASNALVLGVFLISAIVSSRCLTKNEVTILLNE